ncbi:major facilitator superfamily domain-containing protein [Mycena rosella]|uniref:Major facilitator superfamily domain-containing protein n=1 Tax=Mycena rosella TaxID=1033263 RepID=A0AAD7FBZ1_MYCRO|nr:major facilitator superfamily domain-containing protein [Mycena rosella]
MDSTEKHSIAAELKNEAALKLDHAGLPLVPQPSDDPEDGEVNYSRHRVARCVFCTFAALTSNPAYAQIVHDGENDVLNCNFLGIIAIAATGIGSFIWALISNVYGRRPGLIFSQAIAIAAGFGSAYAKSYRTIIFTVISDVFCLHERGKMLGIVTAALINGPHLASLPGGFIAQDVDWRWTLILPSILTLKYFPVGILAWYAAVALTLGSVMPSKTVSALFRTCYKWNSARTGVALSVSTTIGGVLGEVTVSGPVIDKLMERSRKREGCVRPESRLHGIWPAIFLLPADLLIQHARYKWILL